MMLMVNQADCLGAGFNINWALRQKVAMPMLPSATHAIIVAAAVSLLGLS
jgi:hypothetical protein